ncbi:MAG: poly-gamma-glutamate synthase PgsB [Candidatus Marinimicrobia bacterium]|nr:poly-gamma-glutamate synthase PgsB [Candidatus Neomarinimicrobiota bacterium]
MIISLLILFVLLIALGSVESYRHNYHLHKIPIRIHVNGARGKSSVTRLIASGLRESGKKVIAKTTGSSPRIINEVGDDIAIHRLRSASIGEQVKMIANFSKKNIDIMVMECMAVQPQYQWISEQKMLQSTIGVITNVRPDHLDEMGYTNDDIAMSLSNTIPKNGKIVVHKDKFGELFSEIAKKRNTKLKYVDYGIVDDIYMNRFQYFEHKDNVELALKVCKEVGVEEQIALKGILKNHPDPGALVIWKIKVNSGSNYFVSAFAANDPESTLDIWKKISVRYEGTKSCVFLNTRSDRQYRTHQLSNIVANNIIPNKLIIRGDNLDSIVKKYNFEEKGIEVIRFNDNASPKTVVDIIGGFDNHLIMGIGNIVGWGESFVKEVRRYKING